MSHARCRTILIAVQRERARAQRMLALERERTGDRHLREQRLREIEALEE